MPDLKWFHHTLVESLRLVAADYEIQVRSLPKFVCVADEVALLYNDAFLLAPQLVRAGSITDTAYQRLKELDDFFGSFSGSEHSELWTLEAMRTAQQWTRARGMAKEAFKLLGVREQAPNLDYGVYVGSREDADPLRGIEFDEPPSSPRK